MGKSYCTIIAKRICFIMLFCLLHNNVRAQTYFNDWGYPVDDEIVRAHFRDTAFIHDTVYISDIDGFLKQYGCDLKQFAEKYGELKGMTDSLNSLSSDRLYYNFFLPQDSTKKLSNRFIIKEYEVSKNHVSAYADRTRDWDQLRDTSLLRKELLFRFDDNSVMTDAFLNDKLQIRRTLSYMFTIMADNKDIVGINLFFPNFSFKEKRAMIQFAKSVRILMDASENFKPENIRLNITFLNKGTTDENFSYCLLQEAGEVLYIQSSDLITHNYVTGKRMTLDNISNIRFFPQIKSHFYIARYYPKHLDIRTLNIDDFSENSIKDIIEADYPENQWEIYLLILIILIILILAMIILYYTYVPFSSLINNNVESVLLIAIVLLLEISALIISIFRNMCYNDTFTFMQKNPVTLFTLPLIMILIVPFLNGIAKKRRIP